MAGSTTRASARSPASIAAGQRCCTARSRAMVLRSRASSGATARPRASSTLGLVRPAGTEGEVGEAPVKPRQLRAGVPCRASACARAPRKSAWAASGRPFSSSHRAKPRRHHEVGPDGEQAAERLPGSGVVAELELDLSQHRPGRARGRVGGHHPLRHLARFPESVAGHERAGQHLGSSAVVRGPEPERAPRVAFGVSQVGLAHGESPALQEEPGQLAFIPRRE